MLEGDHRGVVGNAACHAQCGGVREIGHRVQTGTFRGEHLGGEHDQSCGGRGN